MNNEQQSVWWRLWCILPKSLTPEKSKYKKNSKYLNNKSQSEGSYVGWKKWRTRCTNSPLWSLVMKLNPRSQISIHIHDHIYFLTSFVKANRKMLLNALSNCRYFLDDFSFLSGSEKVFSTFIIKSAWPLTPCTAGWLKLKIWNTNTQ